MALPQTSLQTIRDKIRRITKAPSPQQITDVQLDEYINTYYQVDMPEELRLKSLFTNYSFYTEANVAEYALPTGSSASGGSDGFTSVEPPLYIDGYQSFYSQSQQQFYTLYPKLPIEETLGQASGVGPYSFTAQNIPFLPREFILCSEDVNGNSINAYAQQQSPISNPFIWNIVGDVAGPLGTDTVNYVTGAINFTFSTAPAAGADIQIRVSPYEPSRPLACLFYDNNFILRPVPDSCYKVEIAAYKTPTQLIASGQSPEIEQWWQLLAFGGALKIFEDRGDLTSRSNYYPLYDEQLRLALRRTLVQQTNERTATIYTEQTQFPLSNYYNRW